MISTKWVKVSAVWALLFAACGCSYEPTYTQLSCSVDDDCPGAATCREGFCVSGDEPVVDMSDDMTVGDDSLPPASITRIDITPTAANVAVGQQILLTATAVDSEEDVVSDAVISWSSSDRAIATVDDGGLVVAVAEGVVDVEAAAGGVSATATVTVNAAAATVTIEPAMPTPLPRGRTVALTARVYDAEGEELTGRDVAWSSSDDATVEVDEDGVAVGLLVGSAMITASVEGISDTVELTVVDNDVARAEILPNEPMLLLNDIKVFEAAIYDSDDVALDRRNRTFTWSASNDAVTSLSRAMGDPDWTQRLQAGAVGTSILSVEVADTTTVTADLMLEVTLPVVDSVAVLDPGVIPVGTKAALQTLVEDDNNNEIIGLPHTWTSSDTTVATIDPDTGELTALAPGTTTITADVDGVVGTRDVDVRFLLDQISAGAEHTCGVAPDGGVYCWGTNSDGRLGNGSTSSTSTPMRVSGSATYTEVHAGTRGTCAVEASGAVHCWGAAGITGAANGTSTSVPRAAFGGRTYTAVAMGEGHACAIEDTGDVWCWGSNDRGQLGDGSTNDSNPPIEVQFNPAGNPIDLALGAEHSCVLTDTPKIWCWGRGQFGALGNGGTADESTPVEVTSSEPFVEIMAGRQVTCGVTNADAVYCWGTNLNGQLGINDAMVNSADTPQLLQGVSMSTVSMGFEHGCGLDAANGEVQCWGTPNNYRLGNLDDATVAYAPVANGANLLGLDVSSGGQHACAVAQDTRPYCWGSNGSGRSGTNANDPVQLPTLVWPAQ